MSFYLYLLAIFAGFFCVLSANWFVNRAKYSKNGRFNVQKELKLRERWLVFGENMQISVCHSWGESPFSLIVSEDMVQDSPFFCFHYRHFYPGDVVSAWQIGQEQPKNHIVQSMVFDKQKREVFILCIEQGDTEENSIIPWSRVDLVGHTGEGTAYAEAL